MPAAPASFRTYRDAHACLGIPGSHMVGTQGTGKSGVRSLKLTCHDGSRDELLKGGERIMYEIALPPQHNSIRLGDRVTDSVTPCACMLVGGSSPAPRIQLLTRHHMTRTSFAHLLRLVRNASKNHSFCVCHCFWVMRDFLMVGVQRYRSQYCANTPKVT